METCRLSVYMNFTKYPRTHDKYYTRRCCNRNNNLVKDVCGFSSNRLKSTFSDTEGLPGDFSLLTLPVRTNLSITCLMCASHCFFNLKIRVFGQIFLLTSDYRIHPLSVYECPNCFETDCFNENYYNSHLKNVRTIKTIT